jgi:catalase (peroxidase I)
MHNSKEDGPYLVGSNRNLPLSTDRSNTPRQVPEKLGDDIEYVESFESLEQSKSPRSLKSIRANVQRHWRRFWCCYLVGVIIFLAIFLPVL